MGDPQTPKSDDSNWRFYQGGEIVPISEKDAREAFDSWRQLSDDRGMCVLLIDQLWQEIDRLRAQTGAYAKQRIWDQYAGRIPG